MKGKGGYRQLQGLKYTLLRPSGGPGATMGDKSAGGRGHGLGASSGPRDLRHVASPAGWREDSHTATAALRERLGRP